ncbi:hypothetical protein AGMMS49545_10360 [Betaproteobacteria bacterium]|nr:hypothetical protein AGMMS49545_10360 [Betaproteobacteria bacterium]GHU44350.1 hypothetical protein AGMMS50289_12440 [Betaproteobacteria bacterium]
MTQETNDTPHTVEVSRNDYNGDTQNAKRAKPRAPNPRIAPCATGLQGAQ